MGSPDFRRQRNLTKPANLLHCPLLHLNARPDAWEKWFTHHGVAFDSLHGMLFDQFMTILEAAAAGLGAALLPRFLIQRELDEGVLVPLVEEGTMETGGYYLANAADRDDYPPFALFKAWLIEEAGSFRERG